MINIKNKQECCGCYACEQACPKKSIEMIVDEEGFWYPEVNEAQCVNCGLCEKVCPVQNAVHKEEKVINSYAAYVDEDEVRSVSSSGGIFTILATNILKQGGVVFGAAFDDKYDVEHIAVESLEELYKLQGSKYLQSKVGTSYKEAKDALDSGRCVLYSGTACQIAGLKGFLRKEYDNLFTIGVLCHGVPSPKVWRKYNDETAKGRKIEKIFFRNKETGWKSYSVEIDYSNGDRSMSHFLNNAYMKLFLSDICLRPSCHACKFKGLDRPADLTLGDCWGIENVMPEMDDDKGTSVILVHSDKGERILDEISSQLVIKEGEVDRLLPPGADSRKSVGEHKNRDKFFKELNEGESIEQLLKLLEPSLTTKVKRKVKRILRHVKNA